MMQSELKIEFSSYWHCGSGLSAGQMADALVVRQQNGLPYVPGKTLKGIIRDALTKAEQFGWLDDLIQQVDLNNYPLVELLMGTKSDANRADTQAGIIRVSSATFSEQEAAWLSQNTEAMKALTNFYASTAINEATGAAQEKSLRNIEQVLPVVLYGKIEFMSPLTDSSFTQAQQQASNIALAALSIALPLVETIGAGRQRGLGQATVTTKELAA